MSDPFVTPWTSPPGSSVHGILQARTLEWVSVPSSRGSSRPRDGTQVSCMTGGFFTAEPPGKPLHRIKRLKTEVPWVGFFFCSHHPLYLGGTVGIRAQLTPSSLTVRPPSPPRPALRREDRLALQLSRHPLFLASGSRVLVPF